MQACRASPCARIVSDLFIPVLRRGRHSKQPSPLLVFSNTHGDPFPVHRQSFGIAAGRAHACTLFSLLLKRSYPGQVPGLFLELATNEKKAKALRRAIRADGFVPVEMVVRYASGLHGAPGIPITFRYPANSFQRVYRDSKR